MASGGVMKSASVNEGHTISVEIALDADFTDDADFGFAIGFERAEDQFVLGNEFVTRQDGGSASWQAREGAKSLSQRQW